MRLLPLVLLFWLVLGGAASAQSAEPVPAWRTPAAAANSDDVTPPEIAPTRIRGAGRLGIQAAMEGNQLGELWTTSILFVAGLLGLGIGLFKLVGFQAERRRGARFLREWRASAIQAAGEQPSDSKRFSGDARAEIVRAVGVGPYTAAVAESIRAIQARAATRLQRGLPTLGIIAAGAPLFGFYALATHTIGSILDVANTNRPDLGSILFQLLGGLIPLSVGLVAALSALLLRTVLLASVKSHATRLQEFVAELTSRIS